jgi:hypothetical protein
MTFKECSRVFEIPELASQSAVALDNNPLQHFNPLAQCCDFLLQPGIGLRLQRPHFALM